MNKILNMYFATHKTCNLRCRYCYIPDAYKSQEPPSDEYILDSLNEFISKAESEYYSIGRFCLHGSEPSLMSAGAMAEAVKLVNKHWEKDNIWGINVSVQTNGVNFTSDYLQELKDSLGSADKLRIGFSIDAPKQVHDYYRNKTYDKVIENYETAKSMGFPVAVLGVVTEKTLDNLGEFADWYAKELKMKEETGIPYKVKFKFASGSPGMSNIQQKEFAKFLIDSELIGLAQVLTPGYCVQSGNECMWFEFDTEGNCYSCNKAFGTENAFGNWKKESFDTIFQARKRLYFKIGENTDCKTCKYELFCNSGCPIDRIKNGEYGGKSLECEFVKASFEIIESKGLNIIEFLNKYFL